MSYESFRRNSALLSVLCASLLVAACGGGGGNDDDGGGGGGGESNAKPNVAVAFPTTDAIFTGAEMVIRGTADDEGTVAGVRVNGVNATSNDGFATWTARIPLAMGVNSVEVVVEDDQGETATATVSIKRTELPYYSPTGVEIDASRNRAIVLDSASRAIFAVDMDSGERTVLSSDAVGSGPMFDSALNLDINGDGTEAVIADYLSGRLFSIDLETGERTVLSSSTLGSGPAIGLVRDVAYDEAGNRSFTVEGVTWGSFNILEIDHATGNRTLIGSETTGSGSTVSYPMGVEWDATNARLVLTEYENTVVFLDPASLERTKVTMDVAQYEAWLYDLALDLDNNRALAIDIQQSVIYAVDLTSGTSTVVYGGAGTYIVGPNALAYDTASGRLLVADIESATIVEVDEATMQGTLLSDSEDVRIGDGETFWATSATEIDVASGAAYVIGSYDSRLHRVDLATGKRTIISNTAGQLGGRIVMDAANDRLLGAAGKNVYAIDLDSGSLDVLHTFEDTGTFTVPSIELDPAQNRLLLYVNGNNEIRELSMDTFFYSALTSPARGDGENLRYVVSMVMDPQRDRLLAFDTGPDELKAVSLFSGGRSDLINSGDTSALRLQEIEALVLDDAGNNVYALGSRNSNLIKVNLDTMQRTAVAGVAAGSQGSLGFTRDLAVDESKGLAWTVSGPALIVLDLVTGESAIISR